MTSSVFVREIEQVCTDLQIHSESTYTFRGELNQLEVPPSVAATKLEAKSTHAEPANTETSKLLVHSLRDLFYNKCYIRDCVVDPSMSVDANQLMSDLKLANNTIDTWDEGWKIYQIDPNGRVSVQKADRSRTANPGEFTKHSYTGMPLKNGDIVSLRVYPGSIHMSDSFYFAFGANLSDQFDEFSLLRFYFNVSADKAAPLLSTLSQRLNYYAIPYRFKTLSWPQLYRRADGTVLYVARRYYPIVASLLYELRAYFSSQLRTEVPMFCKVFLPGLGLAEDPRNGESFGMHRCRLMAQGLVNAWYDGTQSSELRLYVIRDCFAQDGIDWERPYLNRSSMDLPSVETLLGSGFQ